jgi:GNAT superfamily N-acetyltransferase
VPRAREEQHGGVEFTHRVAVPEDLEGLRVIMERAIDQLQQGFLTPEEIRSSHVLMGIDTQLVDDGTYYVVLDGDTIAGCGGWSRRATLYGGDHTPGRNPALLDPKTDPARVRAMYTNPDYARRGVGRLILQLCEHAAASEGFSRLELMGTLAGEPLYKTYGFIPVERLSDDRGGVPVPMVRMTKDVEIRPE